MSVTVKIMFICSIAGVICRGELDAKEATNQAPRSSAQHLQQSPTLDRAVVERNRPSRASLLHGFVEQLYRPSQQPNTIPFSIPRPSRGIKPFAMETHDEPQSSSSGSNVVGCSHFLVPLANLPNRPMSDQSVVGGATGAIGSGIATLHETFIHVSGTIQNGVNSIFGTNLGNEGTLGGWSPLNGNAFGSASTPSKPSFCPSNCTKVCGIPQKTPALRIVGGVDIIPSGKYSWIALIQYYGQNVGTGTLVNDRVVLTTAEIVSNVVVFKQIRVIFGAIDASSSTETTRKKFTVTKGKVHPQYIVGKPFHYNIGFLQLTVPVTISDSFMPICLPSNVDTYADKHGTLAGWGARERDGEQWKTIQEVTIPLYSYDECVLAYPNSTEENICGGVFDPAPADKHRSSCDGDGGAGLMHPWINNPSLMTLIGIALHVPNIGCARTNEPSLFTKVYRHVAWLQSQVTGCYCKW